MIGDVIRRIRMEQGLTLHQLAVRIGVTDSYISLLENNGEEPSMTALRKLSQALRRPITDFFEEETPAPSIARAPDRHVCQYGDICTWEVLTPTSPCGEDQLTMVRVCLSAGAAIHCEGVPEQACIYLRTGAVRIQLSGVEYSMEAGDSLTLRTGIPFIAVCREESTAIVTLSGGGLPIISVGRSGL